MILLHEEIPVKPTAVCANMMHSGCGSDLLLIGESRSNITRGECPLAKLTKMLTSGIIRLAAVFGTVGGMGGGARERPREPICSVVYLLRCQSAHGPIIRS